MAVANFAKFVDLANAIAWPTVVAVAVLLLREPLARALGRTTKVTAFQVSLELAAVPEFQTLKASGGPFALRQPAAGREFASAAVALFEQIVDPSTAEYVVIDLGSGDQWLTSRVYVFSVMLERMRGLQCVVFVETTPAGRRQFLGLATPQHVRWCFASRYPWLEAAFASAYAETVSTGVPGAPSRVSPPTGALSAKDADSVATSYLMSVQSGPRLDPDEWVDLGKGMWEHARWLTGARLERLLDVLIERNWIEQQPDRATEDRIGAIISQEGQFVAICEPGPGRRFRGLIDRDALVSRSG